MVLAGEKTPRGWATGKARAFDAFDAKAEALALLAEAGAPVDKLQVMGEAGPQFHPGQSATLRLGPEDRARALRHAASRDAAQQFDIDGAGRGGRAVPRRDPGEEGRSRLRPRRLTRRPRCRR